MERRTLTGGQTLRCQPLVTAQSDARCAGSDTKTASGNPGVSLGFPQIVVVLSGSMEPGYYRGDILFLNQPKTALNPGDIIVFDTGVRDVPIVHRIIKLHQRQGNTSSIDMLTKVGGEGGGHQRPRARAQGRC